MDLRLQFAPQNIFGAPRPRTRPSILKTPIEVTISGKHQIKIFYHDLREYNLNEMKNIGL